MDWYMYTLEVIIYYISMLHYVNIPIDAKIDNFQKKDRYVNYFCWKHLNHGYLFELLQYWSGSNKYKQSIGVLEQNKKKKCYILILSHKI